MTVEVTVARKRCERMRKFSPTGEAENTMCRLVLTCMRAYTASTRKQRAPHSIKGASGSDLGSLRSPKRSGSRHWRAVGGGPFRLGRCTWGSKRREGCRTFWMKTFQQFSLVSIRPSALVSERMALTISSLSSCAHACDA